MASSIGVVLVNWNGGEFTVPCIRSLLAGEIKPDQIVVVDNGSADDSPTRVKALFPSVVLHRNPTNAGFAAANNLGVKILLGLKVDFIWTLNNDTEVSADCLSHLLRAARQCPEGAGFSGKIFCASSESSIWYAGAFRHKLHQAPKHLLTPDLDSRAINGLVEVPFVSGCCIFAPSSTFLRYGGAIESYFLSEDSEWCWRVTGNGGRFFYVPAATLVHKVSASIRKGSASGGISLHAMYFSNRNQLWAVRTHAGKECPKAFAIAVNVGIQVRNILMTLLRGKLRMLGVLWRGLRDGLWLAPPKDYPTWRGERHGTGA
jgi:GT2 family glycosyltransferase